MKRWGWLVLLMAGCSLLYAEPVADPGSRGVDWDGVKEKIARQPWAARIVDRMRESVRETQSRYAEPPLGLSGWTHEYYCDDDARRLRFDPQKPTEHVCTGCGKVYTGSPYDECWRSFVHNEIAGAMAQAAVLYRLEEKPEYLDYVRKMLLWYAEHFDQFAVHGEHAGKGRVGPQSLDEAVLLTRWAQAYWDICPHLTPDERSAIAEKFLIPDAQFVHAQTRSIHNIPCWHNAALGLVGFAAGDWELVRAAIDGEFGMKNQIQKGVKDDGFWFEGSISYHFYTISALQPLYRAAWGQKYPLEETEKFQRMFTAPARFIFANGEFPATNDGWPGQSLKNARSYYEFASGQWNDPSLLQTLAWINQDQPRDSMEALLYGPTDLPPAQPLPPASDHFEDSGVAFLRNPQINAYFKYGPYGGGHDHLDRLNVILYGLDRVLMSDLGTSGYGIPLNAWFRSPAAHNLLVVDGQRQARCGGYLIAYEENRVAAGVKEAYEGVDIQRRVTLLENGIEDRVTAASEDTHRYDLFYHVRGTIQECSVSLTKSDQPLEGEGYNHLRDVQQGKSEGTVKISWILRDTPGTLTLECRSDQPFEIFTGTCPDNPADLELGFVMLRVNSQSAEWNNRVQVER